MRVYYHDDKPVSPVNISPCHFETDHQGRLPPPTRLRCGTFLKPSLLSRSTLLHIPAFLAHISGPSHRPRQGSRLCQPRRDYRFAQCHGLNLRGQDQNVLPWAHARRWRDSIHFEGGWIFRRPWHRGQMGSNSNRAGRPAHFAGWYLSSIYCERG